MHAGNELSEQVWNPWFGFLVLHSTELHCAPSTNASQLQVFWTEAFGDELGHVDCYLWSEGLHSVIEELCTKLLVVSLLSFWWIFVLIDWFEGLELLFLHLTYSAEGCTRRMKESGFAHADVSHSWVGRGLKRGPRSQRAGWTSVAHDHYMLVRMTYTPVNMPWFSIWTTFVFCVSLEGREKRWTEN